MAKEYDPVRYLDLLEEYTSRETVRVRRNLGIVSFTVIVIEVFKAPLDKLRIAGVPILRDQERLAAAIAAVLLIVWGLLFALRMLRDLAVRKERISSLTQTVKDARERLHSLNSQARTVTHQTEILNLEKFIKAYEAQDKRARRARTLTDFLRHAEWIPTAALAMGAAVICIKRYLS